MCDLIRFPGRKKFLLRTNIQSLGLHDLSSCRAERVTDETRRHNVKHNDINIYGSICFAQAEHVGFGTPSPSTLLKCDIIINANFWSSGTKSLKEVIATSSETEI